MRLTEKQLGGWSLLPGTAAVAFGYALSPSRGVVDNVPSNSLNDLTLAMAGIPGFAYTVPVRQGRGGLGVGRGEGPRDAEGAWAVRVLKGDGHR